MIEYYLEPNYTSKSTFRYYKIDKIGTFGYDALEDDWIRLDWIETDVVRRFIRDKYKLISKEEFDNYMLIEKLKR